MPCPTPSSAPSGGSLARKRHFSGHFRAGSRPQFSERNDGDKKSAADIRTALMRVQPRLTFSLTLPHEQRGGECYVAEYLVGAYAMLERLAAWPIGRSVLKLFGAARKGGGYRVPWDKLDLSDPRRPRLTCKVEELSKMTEEG